ncbi:uncharacterized protein LOC128952898 [Oppia nitens]|uniref:uncharacterized protein LOC128952898 n=1 Tax=Oppia nitens TaxID=1686743 RepID=UPI0023DB8292|nr:uncharacterized protein LOC128952898 [Oppia nitens]
MDDKHESIYLEPSLLATRETNSLSSKWFTSANVCDSYLRKCISCPQINVLNKHLHKTKANINRSLSWDSIATYLRTRLMLKMIDISTLTTDYCQIKLFVNNTNMKDIDNNSSSNEFIENFKNNDIDYYDNLYVGNSIQIRLSPSSGGGDGSSSLDVSPSDYTNLQLLSNNSNDETDDWESDCNSCNCDKTECQLNKTANKLTTISKCRSHITCINAKHRQLANYEYINQDICCHRSNSSDSAIIIPFIDCDIEDDSGSDQSKCDLQTTCNKTDSQMDFESKHYSYDQQLSQTYHLSSHLSTPSVIISDHSTDSDINDNKNDDHNYNEIIQDFDSYFNQTPKCQLRRDSISSISSSTSSLSSLGEEDYVECDIQTTSYKLSPISAWRKVRSLVTSPFIQTYKKQKYPWVQLAGHQGNFICGQTQGTILKKLNATEENCFHLIANDVIKPLVPEYRKTIKINSEFYLELEDLLAKFDNPSIMDIKMGVRTYLEEELTKARVRPKLRKDMYEKMIAIDPVEPTDEENQLKAVTKPRYMVWRETISSTASLGFRIEGIKQSNGKALKDFKRTKSEDNVKTAFMRFIDNHPHYASSYLNKLVIIKETVKLSHFFRSHEIIGSSLLFVHDDHKADIWLIDFAKTYPLPNGIQITHQSEWQVGNHEDGYLKGLDNLIRIFSTL